MQDKFKNYYCLKKYLTVVANNNHHNINLDNYDGLENIYNYLIIHRDKISYNFNFSEWIKLIVHNEKNELRRIADIGKSLSMHNDFDDNLVNNFGLKLFVRSNIDKDMICVYTKPKMTSNIGCYFIYDNSGLLVYIGKSTNDLLTRSCVSANQRVGGNFEHIELKEFNTKSEANIFEIYYISKFKPKYNSESNTKDTLPFEIPDTSISTKYINSIEKKTFDSKYSSEYISYRKNSIENGNILFEIEKGHSYRPVIPLI